MIKSQLISNIAQKFPKLLEQDIAFCVDEILEEMSKALTEGRRIEVRGFGSFCSRYRKPRQAHNPKTGEPVFTRARYRPHFKPGKELRERVNDFNELVEEPVTS